MEVNKQGHVFQGTWDIFLCGNETCPMYHFKHPPVTQDPFSILPHHTSCQRRWVLMDLGGCFLWLQVGLGKQETWEVTWAGVKLVPPCGVAETPQVGWALLLKVRAPAQALFIDPPCSASPPPYVVPMGN